MAASTTFTYNGSNQVQAVSTGLTPSTVHYLVADDGGSTEQSGSSDGSGNLTLTITDISVLSSGDLIMVYLGQGDDNPTHPVATGIFSYGTAGSGDSGLAVTWLYDGASTVTATFTGVGGHTYQAHTQEGATSVAGSSPLTVASPADAVFLAYLTDVTSTFRVSSILFITGESGHGFTGRSGSEPVIPTSPGAGRVLIAFDDDPLTPSPTWTPIDQGGSTFPHDFVSGFDTHSGRQTLISQTETGTATVYINDRSGLFDDRNDSSPFQGKLSGKQVMLQIHNPVSGNWEPQFRGLLEDYSYDIDGSAVDVNGEPINASIQLQCVDLFDYLNGYGMTPGLDGITPPVGAEDSVYYAATGGTADDRIIEIMTDATSVGWVTDMTVIASGNTKLLAAQYSVDESALSALRDAADAELPFIANIYINRFGQFCFRGRYSRFAPDGVAAEPGSAWDFHRWSCGDGKAIITDPTRAQIRVLSYARDRADLINAAICYPQNIAATAIHDQVYANTASITAYGKHEANPLSNLLTADYAGPGTISPSDGKTQCALYAELLVKNKKDPRICPTAVQLKSINTSDFRASATWDVLTRTDISHIINIAVGYPGGTGLTGGATADDYYIEGRSLTVRPANTSYDYIELELEVTPYVWSADTHGVFPAFGS